MPIPDNFKVLDQTELQEKLKDFQPQFTPIAEYKAPEVLIRPNPVNESNNLLREQNDKIDDLSQKLDAANLEISKQTKELQSIHYENMKLNSQIDVLNKTIDSQNDELNRLRDINSQLKITNQSLEESSKSNKHYWRNTILVSLGVGIFSFVLGLFATEVKTLLQEILILLQ